MGSLRSPAQWDSPRSPQGSHSHSGAAGPWVGFAAPSSFGIFEKECGPAVGAACMVGGGLHLRARAWGVKKVEVGGWNRGPGSVWDVARGLTRRPWSRGGDPDKREGSHVRGTWSMGRWPGCTFIIVFHLKIFGLGSPRGAMGSAAPWECWPSTVD